MKKQILIALVALIGATPAVSKKTLGHDDFDRWEKLTNLSVSNNGAWSAFVVNPQEGDGVLTLYNTSSGKKIELPRGNNLEFTADSKWAVAKISPLFQQTRKAKIKKKKGFELPQDSLAIVNLATGQVEKFPGAISFQVGKEGGQWVAWLSCDTAYIKPKALKDKKAGKPMVVRNLATGVTKVLNWVEHYVFSKDGSKLAVTQKKMEKDTLQTDGTGVIILPDTAYHLIDRDKAFYGVPVFNDAGTALAYVASNDSVKSGTKRSSLYMVENLKAGILESKEVKMTFNGGKDSGKLFLNQYSKPIFSNNGKRLVIGVAPEVAPDDTTLVSFETPSLDIWRWDAPFIPPTELKRVEQARRHTFPVVTDLATGKQLLLTDNQLVTISAPDRWDGDWALITDPSENIVSSQWDYQIPEKVSVKNISTGETREVGTLFRGMYRLSPADRYVAWFTDRGYYTYNIADGKISRVGADIPYALWDEDVDRPDKDDEPYGFAGWTENDGRFLVYDRFDLWSVDPTGKTPSVCVTNGEGRKRNVRMRMIRTDRDERFIKNGASMLFSLFNYDDMKNGLATMVYSGKSVSPKIDFYGEWEYTQVKKAKDAGVYSWYQANFSVSPNIYVTRDIEKGRAVKVSDTNPQMAEYNWGTAQLFRWTTYNGADSKGVLYLPEDFDPNKEYPMIAYFYETYSQDLYHHFNMEPSWSWINFPFYVSRGYVIFVPDIHYIPGIPGECAYDYVCSGVEAVCKAYPNIDINRVGIDGQSWGGYQTAYLITRTNMFACAGSGAPVANMTSAFGGIRWESGNSRQGQYEQGQSRIGRNLWEAPDLYIANSPIFKANRVETPLLIMHNDADGAVPWYQGIEYFMALRRLGKPVWMLQYNGEAHNLKERRNRKDITKRLQQFFDHYLKGDPMPEWMKNGIPATRKGQEFGY